MFSDGDIATDSEFASRVSEGSGTEPTTQLFVRTSSEPDQQARNLTFTGDFIRFPARPSGVSPDMCRASLSHITWSFHFHFIPWAREVLEADQRVKIIFIQIILNLTAMLGSEYGGPSSVYILSEATGSEQKRSAAIIFLTSELLNSSHFWLSLAGSRKIKGFILNPLQGKKEIYPRGRKGSKGENKLSD